MTPKSNPTDHAVSPVIGVILMVAITVILSSVIAMYVFGIPMPQSHTTVFTVKQVELDRVSIIYNGGPDTAIMTGAYATVTSCDPSIAITYIPASRTMYNIGDSVIAIAADPAGYACRNHVVVNSTYSDGVEQISLDTYI